MVKNLENSIEYFQENRSKNQTKQTQFKDQKFFLDMAKVDTSIHKVNAILSSISASMINGKFTTAERPRDQSQRKQKSKVRAELYNLNPVKQSMFQSTGRKTQARLDESASTTTKKFDLTQPVKQQNLMGTSLERTLTQIDMKIEQCKTSPLPKEDIFSSSAQQASNNNANTSLQVSLKKKKSGKGLKKANQQN